VALHFGVLTERKKANQVLHDTWIAACVADANFSVTKLLTFLFGEIPRHCLEGVCFILSTVCAIECHARIPLTILRSTLHIPLVLDFEDNPEVSLSPDFVHTRPELLNNQTFR
jgi:hypothetical protein